MKQDNSQQNTIINNDLWQKIQILLTNARSKIYSQINTTIVQTYWHMGKLIVEEEQLGEKRASYGKAIVSSLANKFFESGEKGFDQFNLWKMRQFYITYPILDSLRPELSYQKLVQKAKYPLT